LIQKEVIKFKRNDGEAIEKGMVSIEKLKDKDTYLLIYRANKTKQLLYQGHLLKGISLFGNINNKL